VLQKIGRATPPGWTVERKQDRSIVVIAPGRGDVGCVVGPNESQPRTIPSEVLYLLCSALLAARPGNVEPQQPSPAADTLTARLQQQCSDWGAYWRASDAHGVDLTQAQAVELLREALGVEVAIKPDRDALRYQWHKSRNPGALLAIAWGASREACAEGADVDRATDVAMGDPFPERTAKPAMPMRWVRMEEGPPPENTPVLVWIVSSPGNPGYWQQDEWHEHREDPTGMGGPTLSFGYTWRESDPSEVTHWALIEEPKT
jgi:hypothetical protein